MSQISYAISIVSDGTMKRGNADLEKVTKNRRHFLEERGMSIGQSVLVQLDYSSDDFCRYDVVDQAAAGEGMLRDGRISDGLATQSKDLVLFLPLADCIGAVLYDPEHEALMLTHLGRHNLEQYGGEKSVEFMTEHFGTDPATLEITLTPSAGRENYPLFAFAHKSLQDVACEQFISAGVLPTKITRSDIDTTKNEEYYSHSEFLKGNRETDGRFAIIATLLP